MAATLWATHSLAGASCRSCRGSGWHGGSLVAASPPAGRFASFGPRARGRGAACRGCSRLRVCAIFKLPKVTIYAIYIFILTWRGLVILFVNILNCITQPVSLSALPPTPVFDDVVDTSLAGVAQGLECIACD